MNHLSFVACHLLPLLFFYFYVPIDKVYHSFSFQSNPLMYLKKKIIIICFLCLKAILHCFIIKKILFFIKSSSGFAKEILKVITFLLITKTGLILP